jgi:D-alanyl-D-alanine carboxypeptidase
MTALIALESGKTQLAINLPESFLEGISKATVYDIVNVLMISRSNDAANIIAEAVAGSIEDFVKLMNEKSKELKLKNTNFELPTGLGSNSQTTAEDTVKLMEYSFKNPHFCKIYKTLSYTITSNDSTKTINTVTPLLMPKSKYYVPECIAAKVGSIGKFGNVIAVAEKNANVYLAVLLGIKEEDKTQNKFKDAKALLDAAMNPYL